MCGGLGVFEKRKEVSQLVKETNPFILCLKESKFSVVNAVVCKSVWNASNVDFSFLQSVGASGGIITLRNCDEVEVWSSFSLDHVLGIHGRFVKTGVRFTVLNVYAPCDVNRQQLLWHTISDRMVTLRDVNICVCGDFNVVRYPEERRSVGSAAVNTGSASFNAMIDVNCFVDLPLRGRKFTWCRGDGRSMSRLNRFLLS